MTTARNRKKLLFSAATAAFILFLFAGCASNSGIYAVSGDSGTRGGIYQLKDEELKQAAQLSTLNCLIRRPDSKFLYGTSRRDPSSRRSKMGRAVLFEEKKDGSLALIDSISVGGRTPCHLTLSPDGKFLYTANYSSGDVSEIKLKDSHLFNGKARLIKHSGRSILPRQKSPHPHFTGFDPDGKALYVADLGTDSIYIYKWSAETGIAAPAGKRLQLPPGSGPRHLVFSPDGKRLYSANELNSTVAAFIRKDADSPWLLSGVCSTLKAGKDASKNYPGAIKIADDGRKIFVTNRGDDSIAVISADDHGKVHLVETIPSGGAFPSDISIDDRRLFVVNAKSGSILQFVIEDKAPFLLPVYPVRTLPGGVSLCR